MSKTANDNLPESQHGAFIVIEGTDGSGKATQFRQLQDRLQKEGYEVATFDFPQYDQPSSYFVREYLSGKYGSAEEVGPYTGSIFYALDRYEAAPKIKQALAEGKIVLANRFTPSNMAHQGTKFNSAEERRGYFIWLDNLEFKLLGIPRPNKNIVLRVSAEANERLVNTRNYINIKRDLHEKDFNHLAKSVEVYDDLCQLFPKDFTRIDCVRSNELMSIEQIGDMVWETVKPLLPKPPKRKTASSRTPKPESTVKVVNPYVYKDEKGWHITDSGRQFLKEVVTNDEGNVYAIKDKLNAVTAAAAMARLSRRGDDMRITILDEFAIHAGKDEGLLNRVITQYGDDSVQQLVGQHVVVENSSNLLTKILEWGRLAAYLEQSTRYIFFDQKDAEGKYKYFTPEYLEPDLKAEYNQTLDQIFDLYSGMVHSLTDYIRVKSTVPESEQDGAWKSATKAQACDALRPVLPVSTKSTVGIYASGQALESLIMHLLSDALPEAHEVGRKLLIEARKTLPVFLERIDINERGVATQGYRAFTYQAVKELAEQLPTHYGDDKEPVTLTDYWPKNEMDLVPDMLYEHSHLSLKEIRGAVRTWPFDKRKKVFDTYMGERYNRRHKPGRAIEKAHYSWDLLCDYGIFRDLQRHRIVDDLEWQILTPRYGYAIPDIVEAAGLSDQFEKCFDLSFELYSKLQKANFTIEAQYATLLGHRMRWKITYNAREAFHLHELRTTPQGHPGYRNLVRQMHEKLSEVHPILGEAMKFVNQDEDPELTRLAAERYAQFKLQQLDTKAAKTK